MVSKLPSQARRCAVQFQSPAAITLMRREQQEMRHTGGVQVLDTRQIDADIDRRGSGRRKCGSQDIDMPAVEDAAQSQVNS